LSWDIVKLFKSRMILLSLALRFFMWESESSVCPTVNISLPLRQNPLEHSNPVPYQLWGIVLCLMGTGTIFHLLWAQEISVHTFSFPRVCTASSSHLNLPGLPVPCPPLKVSQPFPLCTVSCNLSSGNKLEVIAGTASFTFHLSEITTILSLPNIQ
jgi:hypothetical protein